MSKLIDREAVLRVLREREAGESYGHAKAAVTLCIDAISALPVETAQATSAERQSTIETLRRADLDAMVRALDADEKVATTGNKDHDNIEALIASLLRAQQQALHSAPVSEEREEPSDGTIRAAFDEWAAKHSHTLFTGTVTAHAAPFYLTIFRAGIRAASLLRAQPDDEAARLLLEAIKVCRACGATNIESRIWDYLASKEKPGNPPALRTDPA